MIFAEHKAMACSIFPAALLICVGGSLLATTACGRRPSSYDLSESASSGAALRLGQTLCSKANCPKMELSLDVEVPREASHVPGSTSIQVPAGSTTQMRFTARLSDRTITRQAAIQVKQASPFIQPVNMNAGSITLAAATQQGSNGTVEFLLRDLSYCKAKSANPANCEKPSIPDASDTLITFTVSTSGVTGQPSGSFVLPSQTRCVQPPSDLEQTVGTLQQAISIGSSLLRGNFIPVITNIAGGLSSGARADEQGIRQGC